MGSLTKYVVIVGLVGLAMLYRMMKQNKAHQQIKDRLAKRPQQSPEAFAERHFPAEQREIAITLRKYLQEHIPFDLAGMLPEDRPIDDLQVNDFYKLALAEFVMAIEEHYLILLPHLEEVEGMTFGEIVAAVHAIPPGSAAEPPQAVEEVEDATGEAPPAERGEG